MLQQNPIMLCLAPPRRPSLFELLTADLPPTVKLLAGQLTSSEAGLALLSYLRCYSHTALSATDLAVQINRPLAEVTPLLAVWVASGLIERQTAACIHFYRLTTDLERLSDLDAVFDWRDRWLAQALSVAQAVGAPLMLADVSASAALAGATAKEWHRGLPPAGYGDAAVSQIALSDWGNRR